ncbi:MAG: hypothetical protein JO159_15780 [Acidobacteria bacterium]|nr:hypothetical protein [Acidobacteriota bacterium]
MAIGTWLPYRVVAWFQFLFWLLLAGFISVGIPEFHRLRFSLSTRMSAYTLFAVILLSSSNFRAALKDLHGPVQSWRRADLLRLKQHGGALEFDALPPYPNLTFHQNLSSDPACTQNRCLANYLGAESVVVRNSSEECPK